MAGGALEPGQRVEQPGSGAQGCLGGMKLLETEVVSSQVAFQFNNPKCGGPAAGFVSWAMGGCVPHPSKPDIETDASPD